MNSIATYDFGTWYDQVCPDPSDVLTLEWGTACAQNVAKITKALTIVGTMPANGNAQIVGSLSANFSYIPFLKFYKYSGSTWTESKVYSAYNFTADAPVADPRGYSTELVYGDATVELSGMRGKTLFGTLYAGTDDFSTPYKIIEYGQ